MAMQVHEFILKPNEYNIHSVKATFEGQDSFYSIMNWFARESPDSKYRRILPYMIFCTNPLGNCQIMCIGYFNKLIKIVENNTISIEILREVLYRIKEVINTTNLLLLDVHARHQEMIEKIFENNIHTVTPYKSTNGSKMIQFLVNFSFNSFESY